jgi:hypothetical protein
LNLFAFKLGAYIREHLINILFVVSGIGFLKKKNWARKMALALLVVGGIYSSNGFAWGLAGGPPPLSCLFPYHQDRKGLILA